MTDQPAASPAPGTPPQTAETLARPRRRLRVSMRRWLRAMVLVAAIALTGFWIYTFHAIGARASPQGDGMEWMAAFPMTLIFLLLTLPALIIGLFGRALILGALVAAAAGFVNVWIWLEILAEFAGHGPGTGG